MLITINEIPLRYYSLMLLTPLSINTPEYSSHLRKEAELSAKRQEKLIQSRTNPPRTTIWPAEKVLKVRTSVGEGILSAGLAATRNIWNKCWKGAFGASRIDININAAQFSWWYNKRKSTNGCGLRPDSLKERTEHRKWWLVAYFIKYFLVIFADGTSDPPDLLCPMIP